MLKILLKFMMLGQSLNLYSALCNLYIVIYNLNQLGVRAWYIFNWILDHF